MRVLAVLVVLLAALPATTAAALDVDVQQDERSESCTTSATSTSSNHSENGAYASYNNTLVESQCEARRDDVGVEVTQGDTRLVSVSKGERSTTHGWNSTTETHEKSAPCDGPEDRCYDVRGKESHNSTARRSQEGVFVESAAGDARILTSWCQTDSDSYVRDWESYERRPDREDYTENSTWSYHDSACASGISGSDLVTYEVEHCHERRMDTAGTYSHDHVGGHGEDSWDIHTRDSTCRLRVGQDVDETGLPADAGIVGVSAELIRSCTGCGTSEETATRELQVHWIVHVLIVEESGDETVVLP